MIVRCGRCQSAFDVPGPGRHQCPACGTLNDVRSAEGGAPGAEMAGMPGMAGAPPPPPQPSAPEPEQPSPRVECDACGFSFIVGAVSEAPCPNCGSTVTVAAEEDES